MKNLKYYGTVLFVLLIFCFGIGAVQTVYSEDDIISMEFDGAPLKDVLKILSQQSGLNFVASEEILSKKVSVSLDHVPVQDALEGIVSANNLRYEKKSGNIYVIYPAVAASGANAPGKTETPVETRVIRLKYARVSNSPLDVGDNSTIADLSVDEMAELGNASSSLSSSTSVGSSTSSGGGAQNSQNSNTSSTTPATGDKGQKSNLMADRGIDKLVASLLSKNGKVAVDIATNSLIVTDTPQKLNEIERIVFKLDVPSSQVILEVYLMEVRKEIMDNKGISLGGKIVFTGPSRTTGFPFTEKVFTANGVPNKPVGGVSANEVLTQGTLNASGFQAMLTYLVSCTGTKILARPRILTLNNQAASIRLVTNTATAKLSLLTAAQSISTLQTGGAERQEVGTTLKITPQINGDQSIDLFLEPSVTTVSPSAFFPNDFLDPTMRDVRTMARVKNNETLVIGGLEDTNRTVTKSKVPLLGDLPFIGKVFRYTNRSDDNTELLIFITPHIVKGYDSLSDPSATAQGKDLAARRMVDAFRDAEIDRDLSLVGNLQEESSPVLIKEKELMIKAAQDRVTPESDKAMSQSLER